MHRAGVRFSILGQAAWAPGVATPEQWSAWAAAPQPIAADGEPGVRAMPPMLRRRLGQLGKMALETAYAALDGRADVPTVFCSRHGETARAIALLGDLAQGEPLSPTGFGMSVHNANAGLFSIARADRANHIALAAGTSTLEHAVIEACGLLADGEPLVLLVTADTPLPAIFAGFADRDEQPHALAWLLAPAGGDGETFALEWQTVAMEEETGGLPGSLAVQRFVAGGGQQFERVAQRRQWRWSRDA